MTDTNYWTNFYLNTKGKLVRRKKTLVPKYLKRAKFFNSAPDEKLPTRLLRDWNRSAYFRYKANQDYINQLEKNKSKSKHLPIWSPPSWSAPVQLAAGHAAVKSRIISPLRPSIKKRSKSETELTPLDLLAKVKHLISRGSKVVLVTPNLVVTRTSPTPEDKLSPTTEGLLKVPDFSSLVFSSS